MTNEASVDRSNSETVTAVAKLSAPWLSFHILSTRSSSAENFELTVEKMDSLVNNNEYHRACSFCRNYLTSTTTTSTSTRMLPPATSPTTTMSSNLSEICPSHSCPSCVRLFEASSSQNESPKMSTATSAPSTPSSTKCSFSCRFSHTGCQLLSLCCRSASWLQSRMRHRRPHPEATSGGVLESKMSSASSVVSAIFSQISSSSSASSMSTARFVSLVVLVLLLSVSSAGACSSRSTPKPRPPSQGTMRPNITFQTYACPPAYAAWYCLNGATCFTVKIADSILYNCECADGYMGQRCEFKDLDGSYLPARERLMMTSNTNVGQVFLVVLLIIVAAIVVSIVFTLKRTKSKTAKRGSNNAPQPDLRFDEGFDFVYGNGSCRSLPESPNDPYSLNHYHNYYYNNNSPSQHGQPMNLNHYPTGQHNASGSLGSPAAFCETPILTTALSARVGAGSNAGAADTSILGQSISYTLSQQAMEDQYRYHLNGRSSLSRHSRVPQVC